MSLNFKKKKSNNYYEETYDKVKMLFLNNKFQEALQILNKELSMPYIPAEFESKYSELQQEVNKNFFIKGNISETQKNLSFDYVVSIFKNFKNEDNEEIHMALNYLSDINVHKFLDRIEEILNLSNLDNWIKSEVFNTLINQNVGKSFVFNGQNLIPKNFKPFEESEDLLSISSVIRSKSKDQLIIETAINLLEFYLKVIFPTKLEKDNQKLYAAVFTYFALKILKKINDPKPFINEWNIDEKKFNQFLNKINVIS